MKSTKYSNFCLQIFGKMFLKHKEEEPEEKNIIFEKANIAMEYEEYYSLALMNILIGFISAFIFAIALHATVSNDVTLLFIFIIPTLATCLLAIIYLYLPTYYINRRAENIDRFLPYAINFISSMAVAGVSPTEIFQTLSTVKVYGELQIEAKRISKEINIMGIDNITALKHAIELSPSKKFKSFLQGMIGTIQSSGMHYLQHRYLKII